MDVDVGETQVLPWPLSQSGTLRRSARLLHLGAAARLELQIQHNVPLSFMHSLYKLGTMNFNGCGGAMFSASS